MIASFSVTPSWCLLSGFDRPDVRFRAPLLSVSAGVGQLATALAWLFSNNSPLRSPLRLVRPPVTSATEGVDHCSVCAANGTPPAPNAWFGLPFSPSEARGVDQIVAARSIILLWL